MPKIKSNDPQSAKSESVGSAVAKPERQRLKRKKSKSESCIRTDLIRLCPNEGKKADLAKLFDSYQAACGQMLTLAWSDWTSGSKRTAANALWRQVQSPQPLGGQLDHTPSRRTRGQGVQARPAGLDPGAGQRASEACRARAGLTSMLRC